MYCKTTTTKELWESLERKYKNEDAGTKKFMVACFLDYKMVDSKNVITQVQDLQVLLHDIHAKGMTMSETFQVAAIIEKLPPSWVEFKNYLKRKRKEMSVEDLVHVGSSSKSNSKGKGKGKVKNDKKSKGKVTPRLANIVNDNVNMIAMVSDVIVMISKVNLGEGDVILKMTSKKELKLTNSDKIVLSKNQMYVGEGYALNDIGDLKSLLIKVAISTLSRLLMKSKNEAIDKFVLYKSKVENQLGRKIKVVQSDRGGEYVSSFTKLCAKHRIRHEFTSPYSP
ncbi:pol polyprotein [Tanacetum coccineum]|uniref:Pol polyprotein n=1 Tax=Tanacetum coccineum TaxID=301880 RepID=A0ABQ4XTK5_9ASTR